VDLDLVAEPGSAVIERRDRVKPERDIAGCEAREHATFEPAQGLIAQVIKVEVGDKALDRERELRVFLAHVDAVRDADERHLLELEAL